MLQTDEAAAEETCSKTVTAIYFQAVKNDQQGIPMADRRVVSNF
jgi:hypothetical protein